MRRERLAKSTIKDTFLATYNEYVAFNLTLAQLAYH